MRLKEMLRYNFKYLLKKFIASSLVIYFLLSLILAIKLNDYNTTGATVEVVPYAIIPALFLFIFEIILIYYVNFRLSFANQISRKTTFFTTLISSLIIITSLSVFSLLFEWIWEPFFGTLSYYRIIDYISEIFYLVCIGLTIASILYMFLSLHNYLSKNKHAIFLIIILIFLLLCTIVPKRIVWYIEDNEFPIDSWLIISILCLIVSLVTLTIHYIFFKKLSTDKCSIIK